VGSIVYCETDGFGLVQPGLDCDVVVDYCVYVLEVDWVAPGLVVFADFQVDELVDWLLEIETELDLFRGEGELSLVFYRFLGIYGVAFDSHIQLGVRAISIARQVHINDFNFRLSAFPLEIQVSILNPVTLPHHKIREFYFFV
jgi:hypothetical protein